MQYIYAIYLHTYQAADLRCLPTATLVLSYTRVDCDAVVRDPTPAVGCLRSVMRSPPPAVRDAAHNVLVQKKKRRIQGNLFYFLPGQKNKRYMMWWWEMIFCGAPIYTPSPRGEKRRKKELQHQCWRGLLLPITLSDICLFIRGKKKESTSEQLLGNC